MTFSFCLCHRCSKFGDSNALDLLSFDRLTGKQGLAEHWRLANVFGSLSITDAVSFAFLILSCDNLEDALDLADCSNRWSNRQALVTSVYSYGLYSYSARLCQAIRCRARQIVPTGDSPKMDCPQRRNLNKTLHSRVQNLKFRTRRNPGIQHLKCLEFLDDPTFLSGIVSLVSGAHWPLTSRMTFLQAIRTSPLASECPAV